MVLYEIKFPNNKKYIGITTRDFKTRMKEHRSRAKSQRNLPLYNAMNKYPTYVAQPICSALSLDWLKELEIEFIKSADYNLTLGGEGASGYKHTTETKQRMSKSHLGKALGSKNPMFGKPSPKRIKVYCIETNETFESVTVAAKILGTYRSVIKKVISGERSHANGYTFKYLGGDHR